MKSPELTKSEGKKIDAFYEKQKDESHAKEIIDLLFGKHPTLKEIMKL